MKMRFEIAGAVLFAAAAFAQSPQRVEFEVASVKPTATQLTNSVRVGVTIDGAQVHCQFLSIKDLLSFAYNLKFHQIVGPDWISSARFDISAKLPSESKRGEVREMMKSLLEDRFQLKVHRESKEFPVYALVVGKGPLRLKEVPVDSAEDLAKAPVDVKASGGPGGTSVDFGHGSSFTFGNNKFEAKKLTMSQLADNLTRFMDKPVVDMTGLPAAYDFTLEFTPEDYRAMLIRSALAAGVTLPPEALRALDASGDSLLASIQALGLKLDSRKAPIDVIVVDSGMKTPTEN